MVGHTKVRSSQSKESQNDNTSPLDEYAPYFRFVFKPV